MTKSRSTLPSQTEVTSRTPGGLWDIYIMREAGFGCPGLPGHLHLGGRVNPIRMGMRTAQRWTHKMRAMGGWTWTAVRRITGFLTTQSAKRSLKHEFSKTEIFFNECL